MNFPEKCPFCGKASVVWGKIESGYVNGEPASFKPEGIHVSTLEKLFGANSDVRVHDARACLQCGQLWAGIDAAKLQEIIRKYGTGESKTRLEDNSAA